MKHNRAARVAPSQIFSGLPLARLAALLQFVQEQFNRLTCEPGKRVVWRVDKSSDLAAIVVFCANYRSPHKCMSRFLATRGISSNGRQWAV